MPLRLFHQQHFSGIDSRFKTETDVLTFLGHHRLEALGFTMYGHDKAWFWVPPSRGYEPSDAIGLFTTLKRKRLLESVAHTLHYECVGLRGGQTFYVDQQHLDAFDRACSVSGPFYALKDTVFFGSFTARASQQTIRTRVSKVLLELISCGLWTLEGFVGIQSMTALNPSLLPSFSWLRSRPVTRASADEAMLVDSEGGDSSSSSALGSSSTVRLTRGSASSGEHVALPLSVQSNPAPPLPFLFCNLDSSSNASLIAMLERTLIRVSDPILSLKLSCKEVCSEWPADLFFLFDGRDFNGRHVAKSTNYRLCVSAEEFEGLKEHLNSKYTNYVSNRSRLSAIIEKWKENYIPPLLRFKVPLNESITSWFGPPPSVDSSDNGVIEVMDVDVPVSDGAVTLKPFFWEDPLMKGRFTDNFVALVRHLKFQCCISGNQIRHVLALTYFMFTGCLPPAALLISRSSLSMGISRLDSLDFSVVRRLIREADPYAKVFICADDTDFKGNQNHVIHVTVWDAATKVPISPSLPAEPRPERLTKKRRGRISRHC